MEYREENNYPKAFIATAIVMGALMALCFLLTFKMPAKPEEGTGGILVNYGTSDQGMGSDYTNPEEISRAENANKTKPDKITPSDATVKSSAEQSDKKVVTQNSEDAPTVADNSKKNSNAVTTDAGKASSKPVINQNALYKGAKTTGTGAGDGNTNTPGNQGKPDGSLLTNNYDGTGSGNGGVMSNRHFLSQTTVANPKRLSGKVVVDIRADKDGNIVYAKAGARGTTITDGQLWQACEDAAKRDRVNASDLAPDSQNGTRIYNFKLQ